MKNFIFCLLIYNFAVFSMSLGGAQAQISADTIPVPENASSPADAEQSRRAVSRSQQVEQAIEEAAELSADNIGKEAEILHPWKDALPFELNMQKLRSFIIAGRAIEKINRKWDVLIAGAREDNLAIEYQKQLAEESALAIDEVPGITLEEYEAMYTLNLNDDNFLMLVRALNSQIYSD